jgi:hypothetical protein
MDVLINQKERSRNSTLTNPTFFTTILYHILVRNARGGKKFFRPGGGKSTVPGDIDSIFSQKMGKSSERGGDFRICAAEMAHTMPRMELPKERKREDGEQ